jgi:hypothetical protein
MEIPLDLENPQHFTEKIQYIKLYDRTELRKTFADRLKARTYVSDKIGSSCLIPLLGTFDELTEDAWEALPRQFVLKANHGSGMLHIVYDKSDENYHDIHQQTEIWKSSDYEKFGREWAYKGLPRTIVTERLLLDSTGRIPKDYKFFCFNGRVKIIQIDFDRFGDQKRNLYDRDFNQIDATLLYPKYLGQVKKPAHLEKAIQMAEELAAEVNFVRVDLYLVEDQIYFGELTNYPGNGFYKFEPEEMEYKVGDMLTL